MKKDIKKKIVKDVKSFVVDRAKWLRGEGDVNSCLLTTGNRMCCLGFYARACGLEDEVIRNLTDPGRAVMVTEDKQVSDKNGKLVTRKSEVVWDTKLVDNGRNTLTASQMMVVNDDENLADEVRETKLTALFKKLGIKIKFKG